MNGDYEMKTEWGNKRQCKKCAANFYDLNNNPITCPKCSTSFSEEDFVSRYARHIEKPDPKLDVKRIKEEENVENIDEDVIIDDDFVDTNDTEDFDTDVALIDRHIEEEQ